MHPDFEVELRVALAVGLVSKQEAKTLREEARRLEHITDVAVQLWGPSELDLEGPHFYLLDEGSVAQRVPALRRIRR